MLAASLAATSASSRCPAPPLYPAYVASPAVFMCTAAIDDEQEDDDDDEEEDRFIAFRTLAPQRWAPRAGKGSRWVQRDSDAALAINKLLAAQADIHTLDGQHLVKIRTRIGEGRFGDVILGERVGAAGDGDVERVAVKMALRPTSQLSREAAVLSALRGVPGFPELLHYQPSGTSVCASGGGGGGGSSGGSGGSGGSGSSTGSSSGSTSPRDPEVEIGELLVMQLLGPSLQARWETHTAGGAQTCFPTPTVLHVGRSALRCLEALHRRGWVHNDLKPANIVLGAPGSPTAAEAHLIDFGSATRHAGAVAGADTPHDAEEAEEAAAVVGSMLFASVSAHEGRRPARPADDLESLCYVLAHMASGALPWHRERYAVVAAAKRRLRGRGGGAGLQAADALLAGEGEAARVSPAMARALAVLWAEVERCHSAADEEEEERHLEIDYAACLAALSSEREAEGEAGTDGAPLAREGATLFEM